MADYSWLKQMSVIQFLVAEKSKSHEIHKKILPLTQETEDQSLFKSYQRLKKWYLMPPYLTLSIIS